MTQQYLLVLQAIQRADLQDTLLVAAQGQLVLAQARALVGSGTALDVSRAEVAVGQAQVQVLQERNQIEIEKLRLFQQMGVEQPADVTLTTRSPRCISRRRWRPCLPLHANPIRLSLHSDPARRSLT